MRNGEPNRFYYISFFVLFGLVIALVTSVVYFRLTSVTNERIIRQRAEELMAAKIDDIAAFLERLDSIVAALRDNILLYEFIKEPIPANRRNAEQLFFGVASSEPELMQARFIDQTGLELIRVNNTLGRLKPSIVPKSALQPKGHRYYFQQANRVPPGGFWYSRLDLNVEHGQIEKPLKPVIRVASPLFIDGERRGLVIVNFHAEPFLEKLVHNHLFEICLVDRDGYVIVAPQHQYSWSRYLGTGYRLQSVFPTRGESVFASLDGEKTVQVGNVFAADVSSLLARDGAVLVFRVFDATKRFLEKESRHAVLLVLGIIVLLSLPLAWLISRGPVRLYGELARSNTRMRETLALVDEHIGSLKTDADGRIREISTAMQQLLGCEPSELMRRPLADLVCGEGNNWYHRCCQWVTAGKTWRGELQLQTGRSRECLWVNGVVDRIQEGDGFSGLAVICHDISDKKRVELLSITDGLTGLYNRRHFDTVVEGELKRAKRERRRLGFGMLDVDCFKQYNDTYGHQKGDEVLKRVAAVLLDRLRRPSDSCFRLGGEEFGMLFLDMDQDEARTFMESIRNEVAGLGLEHSGSEVERIVTVSIGFVSQNVDDTIEPDQLYRIVDDALYSAKKKGRNRVEAGIWPVDPALVAGHTMH